jgi:hypothetical protein
MPRIQEALSSTAYALFAFEQPLSLEEIAQGARAGAFPAGATHTPDWFAAAAEADSLLETAPELRVLPTDLEEADRVDVSGMDLIRVYAPEMQVAEEEPAAAPPAAAEKPRTSTQLGLLKELGNLDA